MKLENLVTGILVPLFPPEPLVTIPEYFFLNLRDRRFELNSGQCIFFILFRHIRFKVLLFFFINKVLGTMFYADLY